MEGFRDFENLLNGGSKYAGGGEMGTKYKRKETKIGYPY